MEHILGRADHRVQLALCAVVVLGGCEFLRKSCRKGKGLAGLPGGHEPLEARNQSSGAFGIWTYAWGPQDHREQWCVAFAGH